MDRLIDYQGRHQGEDCLVLGLGPSIRQIEDPRMLDRYWTIGVNDIARIHHPDYLVLGNPPQMFGDGRWLFVKHCHSNRIFVAHSAYTWNGVAKDFGNDDRLVKMPVRSGDPDFRNPHIIPCHMVSPYMAAGLAVHMGFKRIGVLGVDMRGSHFWKDKRESHSLEHQADHIGRWFVRLAKAAKQAGSSIVNCSEDSILKDAGMETIDWRDLCVRSPES